MSICAGDIEAIEIQMKLIALNAIVKACRMGEKGASLAVLAEAIHLLSVETDHQVNLIPASLKSITDAAEKLSAGIELEKKQGEAELDCITRDLTVLISNLHQLNEDSVSVLKSADEARLGLSDEIEEFATEITVHEKFDRKITQLMSELDAIVARSRVYAPPPNDRDEAESLRALETRYTMHSERRIHQTVATATTLDTPQTISSTGCGAPEAKDRNEEEEEELGDNVELF